MKKTFIIALIIVLALTLFTGCAKKEEPKPAEEQETAEEQEDASAEAESETDKESHVAGEGDKIEETEVVEEGMSSVYAKDIKEGTYPVEMVSSSSMFKADHTELVVEGEEMKAILYMTSEAYLYMFAGTAEEADKASEEDYILPEETGDGMRTFTLPLAALDSGELYAAYSKKKELWYDRTLLFRVDSLPMDAFKEGVFTTLESLGLSEGEYTAEVTLIGGSGRAGIETPAKLSVGADGATLQVVWSSSNYDYMIVGGEKYLPVNTEGNSTYEIPVSYFDRPIKVLADTTAMSEPYEIEYAITVDSSSIRPVE
ncbi:MAG: hypothetical protein IJS33_00160 [Firmicutes bacterium]|nr:hypothetical protein [Bacillota bacterium]